MSIISSVEKDHSSALAKHFAQLTLRYLSEPGTVDLKNLDVPLENLFRLSEMYRYDAFCDEPRAGVLAIVAAVPERIAPISPEESWSTQIEAALRSAFSANYSDSPDEAVERFQGDLREVANEVLTEPRKTALCNFLEAFQSELH